MAAQLSIFFDVDSHAIFETIW